MNIRKALGDKRKRLLLIPVILLICCCLCGVVSMAIYSASSPSFELDAPNTNNVTVNDSKINIKFGCIKIDKISLDGNLLSSDAKYEICSKGKTYNLNEGENKFEFKGIDEKGESKPEYIIKLNINYEKKVEQPKQEPVVETPAQEEPKATEEKLQEPAPKQYKTVEEWEDVTLVSGSSDKKTDPFTIYGKRWKVIYTLTPQNNYQIFSAHVYKPGASYYSDTVTTFAEESGETTLYSKGEFYLNISSANTGWTVKVQQLVDKQIEI